MDQHQWREILPQPREGSPHEAGTLSVSVKAGVIRFGKKTTEYWNLRKYKSMKASEKLNEPGLVAFQFCENGDGYWALRSRESATVVNAMRVIRIVGMKSGCYYGHREKSGFIVIDFNQPIELFEKEEGA